MNFILNYTSNFSIKSLNVANKNSEFLNSISSLKYFTSSLNDVSISFSFNINASSSIFEAIKNSF